VRHTINYSSGKYAYNMMTNQNKSENRRAAISAAGAMDATAFTELSEARCGVRDATNLSDCRVIDRCHDAEQEIRVSSARGLKSNSPVPAEEEY
jgi:hypothetical protein